MARASNAVTSGSPDRITVNIANGASLSDIANVAGRLVGVEIPAAWSAAGITFQGSFDGATFSDIWDGALGATAAERTIAAGNIPVAATRYLSLSLNDWTGLNYVRVRSGTSAAPVNQGAARSIGLITAG